MCGVTVVSDQDPGDSHVSEQVVATPTLPPPSAYSILFGLCCGRALRYGKKCFLPFADPLHCARKVNKSAVSSLHLSLCVLLVAN